MVEPGEGAEALTISLLTPVLRSNTGSYEGVIVQALDKEGTPVSFPCKQVHLASSSPLSVDVAPLTEVPCDQDVQYVVATL